MSPSINFNEKQIKTNHPEKAAAIQNKQDKRDVVKGFSRFNERFAYLWLRSAHT